MFIGGLTAEVLGCCMRDQSHSSSSYIENFANFDLTTNVRMSNPQSECHNHVREPAATVSVKHLICLMFIKNV